MLFTGGGTGGHVYPGIAVAREVAARRSTTVVWIGSTSGIERSIVRRAGIPFVGIPAGKLRRYLSVKNISDLFRTAAGLFRAFILMGKLRPAVLFSKGGFASVPPVIAAWLRRVPVVTHESDADPGLATRINARFAARILVPYESTQQQFPSRVRSRVIVTGNPVRREILRGDRHRGMCIAGFDPGDERPIILILGGSLGARQINAAFAEILGSVFAAWRVIHQTGGRSADLALPHCGPDYYRSGFFTDELPHLIACADVVVSRSGAGTLWELAALSKPMVLVPLGAGSRGDQERNARVFEHVGGAIVLRSESALGTELTGTLALLRDRPDLRQSMGNNARSVIRIDSCDRIVAILEGLLDAPRLRAHVRATRN